MPHLLIPPSSLQIHDNPISSEHLENFIFSRKWDKTHKILLKRPDLAKVPNKFGDLPLHTALWIRAPEDIILYIIGINENAARISNNRLCFPLHIAASSGSSFQVVVKLLHCYPKALDLKDKQGNSPHDYINNSNNETLKEMIMLPIQGNDYNSAERYSHLEKKRKRAVEQDTMHIQMQKMQNPGRLKLEEAPEMMTARLDSMKKIVKCMFQDVVAKTETLYSEIDCLRNSVNQNFSIQQDETKNGTCDKMTRNHLTQAETMYSEIDCLQKSVNQKFSIQQGDSKNKSCKGMARGCMLKTVNKNPPYDGRHLSSNNIIFISSKL